MKIYPKSICSDAEKDANWPQQQLSGLPSNKPLGFTPSFPISHSPSHTILARAVTITSTSSTSILHSTTHAGLGPNRQVPVCIPLILGIVWRPLEMPISDGSTPLNLIFQAVSIRTQLCVREVLAANLKFIQKELVRDVTAVLVGFLSRRLQLELPAPGASVCAAELVVVRVVGRVVAIAVVDDGFELSYAVVDG